MRDEELREQFAGIAKHFERIDQHFERMDQRFERFDQRFEHVLQELAETRRVLALEILNTRRDLGGRIDSVDQKLDAFRDETHTNFDDVDRRFDHLESEYDSISAGLRRVEKRFSEDA